MRALLSACRAFGGLHAAKLRFDRLKAGHPLDYLFWETTLACNLSCAHCGSRCSPDRPTEADLPGAEVMRIFRELAEDFPAQNITIAVTGGEPLVRRDMFEIMSEAHRLGFSWGMVTNGVLIEEETVRRMEEAGMATVSVSIDGDEQAHGALRGGPEAYRKAVRGLRLLTRGGRFLRCIQATSVISRRNMGLLDRMYDDFASLGVDEWRLLMADPIGRMRDPDNRGLVLDGGELRRLLDFVALKRRIGPLAVTFEESGFLGLEYEGAVRDAYFQCPAGITVGGILHDGAIGACPSLDRRLVEGDARSERFSRVWNARFQRYRDRESTRRTGPCAACKWWSYCEGGSLHLWDWEQGGPRLCHYRMLASEEAGNVSTCGIVKG